MTDRNLLLESAFDSLPEGIAVFDTEGAIVFWNQAAQAISGYAAAELHATDLPSGLNPLLTETLRHTPQEASETQSARGTLVHIRHHLGHEAAVILRSLVLRDGLGNAIGTAALFHPAARLDALPHGETGDDPAVATSQADFEERLHSEFDDFERGGQSLGVLWITVDQGAELRKTHGVASCQAMLEKVQRALASGLRPAEELGRWGEDEFLVLAHERSSEMLCGHARTLAGLARTADFRWWGDRISLTVSIGAAQACPTQSLNQLLDQARAAMENSLREGGNRVTFASRKEPEPDSAEGGTICTPS